MLTIQVITCISVVVAVVAMIAKAIRYITAPQGMRWELYPVPHEKGRAEYGGSYLEELDWWTKKRETDTFNELKEMFTEIVLLKGVFHNNKKVWVSSFPFHFGMYLCIGWLGLLLVGAVMNIFDMPVGAEAPGILGQLVHWGTLVTGYPGLILSGLGALGLLIWRAGDKGQRRYNAPIDYFNLVFFVAMAAVTLVATYQTDQSFGILRSYIG
ncbi:MAG: hypothetical protein KKA42_15300, partial [candidate division Zixibacteria bacterium]|nr:hypothetical protein [candidate division Zixibacteria bacterium]